MDGQAWLLLLWLGWFVQTDWKMADGESYPQWCDGARGKIRRAVRGVCLRITAL